MYVYDNVQVHHGDVERGRESARKRKRESKREIARDRDVCTLIHLFI